MKPLFFAVAIACAALPARAIPVSVVVLGPDDKPLPDATIDLRQSDGSSVFGRGITGLFAAPTADGAGRFSFDFDGAFIDLKAPIMERMSTQKVLWARISAPGMATQTRLLTAPQTTIHLTPGRSWSGEVRDQSDRPVEGVRVQLKGWNFGGALSETDDILDAKTIGFNPIDDAWTVAATSDAQGRWQLEGLPKTGTARVSLSKTPFARVTFNLPLKGEIAPPLFLSPGASVIGQVTRPDGQPLADQLVVAGWSGDADSRTRTDAQGRFQIDGLAPGQTVLSAQDPRDYLDEADASEPEFLLSQQNMVVTRAGETTDVGEWKAQIGTEIKLSVVDAVTGKAVEGAQFNSFSGGDLAKSDGEGQLTARVMSGDSRYPNTGSVRAESYMSYSLALLPPKTGDGQPVDLGTIKLERGSVVSGTSRVAGETKPTDLPTLSFQMGGAGDDEYLNLWDGDGTFKSRALKPGNYSVYAYKSFGSEPSKDWAVVSPKQITVPAPGVAMKPIEVIFKRLTPAKPLVKSAKGRIVDENGVGVAGAIVGGQFAAGYNSSGALGITDANGDWSAQAGIAANEFKLLGVERPGYVKSGEAKIELSGGVAAVSGLSLKRRGAAFSARVVAADGTAASGAWIAVVEDRDYAPIRADENGNFTLTGLALDKFTLLAAKGDDWARIETNASAKDGAIKLSAPAAFERDAAIETALQGKVEWYRVDYWDILGTERMSALVARGEDENGWSNYQFALQLAEREPATFLARAPMLMEKTDNKYGYQDEVAARWRLVQAQNGDADAKIAANNWVDEQKAQKKAINAASVTQLLQTAAVASALERADAADLGDYAAALAAQISSASEEDTRKWGTILGRMGAANAQRFAEGLKPIPELNAWEAAVPLLAKSGDVAGTQAAIARMETLAATPEWMEKAKNEFWNNPTEKINCRRVEAARDLSETDMPFALSLIANLDDSDYSKGRAARTLADRALAAGDTATAEKLLRGAMQSRISNAEGFALTASLAQRVSPEFGAEMWAAAFRHAVPARAASGSGDYEPSVAMWAFYHARLDAAQSRALIEREWNWRLANAVKSKDSDEFGEEAFYSRMLTMAMGAVDPARALEMRAQFAAATGKAPDANAGLAATLLADEAERARMGVDTEF